MKQYFPFLLPGDSSRSHVFPDFMSALAVTFMAVPQGVAYAVIAGLPPAMGLYAASIPCIVGGFMRSSKHVITGPTNALSLLVAGAVAGMTQADPLSVGVTLALMVGVMQFSAGALRLGAFVDYISNPVVLGYITGAGLLIGIGQLPNVTGTLGGQGWLGESLWVWVQGLAATDSLTLTMALSTSILILIIRRINKRIPSAIIALGLATTVSWLFGFHEKGLKTIADLAPIPQGLPPLTLPDLSLLSVLFPVAFACTVLSLVESSAVARSVAADTRQRLQLSVEFTGQGLANIAAGLFGGYPISGSLARTAINHQSGARSRYSGMMAGVMMLLILLVAGPVVNETPMAALAGLLLVVASDLVKTDRIRQTLNSNWSDRISFIGTLLGTWVLTLDQAIYVGVAISIIFFLRQARVVNIRQLTITEDKSLVESEVGEVGGLESQPVRILQLEGHLFFGAVGQIQNAIEILTQVPKMKVLILRLRQAHGMDVTVATQLIEIYERLTHENRYLILTGVNNKVHSLLTKTGVIDKIGAAQVFTAEEKWFEAFERARTHAETLAKK